MKVIELRKQSDEELREQISTTRQEIFNLRFQRATGQLENHRQLRTARQQLARLSTLLSERAAGGVE
jgi:large subunit ribosomal protein L29